MFQNTRAFTSFSVDDVDAARAFYADTLGLELTDRQMGEEITILTLHVPGTNGVLIYPKPDHTPASFTVLNFPVEDIESAVDELASRGIRFERYEGTDLETDEKGIFRGGGPLIAWFTDPAGNVLSVLQDS